MIINIINILYSIQKIFVEIFLFWKLFLEIIFGNYFWSFFILRLRPRQNIFISMNYSYHFERLYNLLGKVSI